MATLRKFIRRQGTISHLTNWLMVCEEQYEKGHINRPEYLEKIISTSESLLNQANLSREGK
tara:strand:+ start:6072 stop:6254 length:183 start_codon:yes stop_codon:yes gene_type:complete